MCAVLAFEPQEATPTAGNKDEAPRSLGHLLRFDAEPYVSKIAYTLTNCTQMRTLSPHFVAITVHFCVHFAKLYATMDVCTPISGRTCPHLRILRKL